MKSYIPASDSLAADWATNFATVLAADEVKYNVTVGQSANLVALAAAFVAAFGIASAPATRTASTIAAKDDARAAFEAYARPIATAISINPDIDPADKVTAGVTLRVNGSTPIPPPTVAPQLGLRTIVPNQFTVEATNPTNGTKAKPEGVVSIVLAAVIGTAFTQDPTAAVTLGRYTRGLMAVAVDPSKAGQKVSLFARYETRSGPGGAAQAGPWSAPLNFHAA